MTALGLTASPDTTTTGPSLDVAIMTTGTCLRTLPQPPLFTGRTAISSQHDHTADEVAYVVRLQNRVQVTEWRKTPSSGLDQIP